MFRSVLSILLLFATAAAAHAQLNVVATTSSMGMLAETVGGDSVSVDVLAPPDRDAHHLEVRPSMMVTLRRADLVVAVGAGLEVGWLPPAIDGSGNRRLQPGRPGHFAAAAQVERIGTDAPADRSRGHVHPEGNPHVYMDPVRMGEIAHALADRLAELKPASRGTYRANADAFADAVERRMPDWRDQVRGAPGVVLYHQDADYLLKRLDVPVLGYLEPVPGTPPTGSHLRSLVDELEGARGVVIHYPYQRDDHAAYVADRLGWEVHELAPVVAAGADADDYFALVDAWVNAIGSAGGG